MSKKNDGFLPACQATTPSRGRKAWPATLQRVPSFTTHQRGMACALDEKEK